jgi:hypothetical protein
MGAGAWGVTAYGPQHPDSHPYYVSRPRYKVSLDNSSFTSTITTAASLGLRKATEQRTRRKRRTKNEPGITTVTSPKMLLSISTLLLLRAYMTLAEIDTRVCYDASNNVAKDHKPCISPTTQEVSHCCSTMDTCIGDTLYLSQFFKLYVGSCTIKDWTGGANGKSSCPKYCSHGT